VSYQVFARKYRPKTFADVLGQEHVVRTLRNAIAQNRLAHAYLFVGPRGTGKTSTARIFAMALNCPNGPSVEFDYDDPICKEIAEGNSLDVLEIDGASNNGVEDVRNLRESVKYAPSRCRYKIYYIDEVHMLSASAFNALLKTLEEPPPHVKFIFATTEANKILPTIISRCQRFDLRRIPLTIIANHLLHIAKLEGVDLDEKAAFAIGKGADGGMRDAQSMLDQLVAFCGNTIHEEDVLEIFGFTSVQTVSAMAQRILESSTVGALQLVHETSEAGKDLGKLLTDLIQHFRTLLVSQADPEAGAEDLEPDIAAQVTEQSQMASTEQLLRVVDGLAEVDARMRWATNKRLHFELGVIQAVQNYNEVSLSDVIEALDGGGTASLSRPVQRPQVTAARPAAPERAPVVERVLPKMEEPAPRPEIKAAPASAPAPEAPEPAPVALEVSPPKSLEIEPIKIQESAPAPEPAKAAVSHEEFWPALIELVQERRALIASWVQLGTVQSIARGIVKVGFPTTESHAKDSLNRDNQRTFLEGIAEELLGVPMKFEFVLDASLRPPPVTELHFDLGDSIPAKPAPAPAAKPEPVPAPKPAAEEAGPVEAATAASISEDFQNDPLIKSAVEKFKLKLAARS
jgi:DNA polymerase-3 subunit gamma/tau